MKKDSKELKRYNRQSKAIIAYIEMIKQYDALIAEAELYYSMNHNSSVFDNFKRIFNGLSSEYGVGTYENSRINYMLEVVRVMYKVNEFLTFRYCAMSFTISWTLNIIESSASQSNGNVALK